VDEIQFRLGEGPCVDAIEEATTYRSDDLEGDPRWRQFGTLTVRQTGVRSMLAHRVFVDGHAFGALNLFADRTGAFGEADEAMGMIFATHAALAVQAARAEDRARDLAIALESNRRIGTAIGILMVRRRLREREAFDLLRRFGQEHHIRLAVAAERVLSTAVLVAP
jgi:GAF domain-containing protein